MDGDGFPYCVNYPGVTAIDLDTANKYRPKFIQYLTSNLIDCLKKSYPSASINEISEFSTNRVKGLINQNLERESPINRLLKLAYWGVGVLIGDIEDDLSEYSNPFQEEYERAIINYQPSKIRIKISGRKAKRASEWFKHCLISHRSIDYLIIKNSEPSYFDIINAELNKIMNEYFSVRGRRIIPNLLRLSFYGLLGLVGEALVVKKNKVIQKVLNQLK